jgi:hypothetical protein
MMAGNDPWAKTWTLNDADSKDLRQVLLLNLGYGGQQGDGINSFTLVQVYDHDYPSRLIGYRVTCDSKKSQKMADCWNDCYLFIRGDNTDPATISTAACPSRPLPPWTRGVSEANPPQYRGAYQTVSHGISQRNYVHPAVVRLEGDIHPPNKEPEAVTFWQVLDPRVSDRTFLCVKVHSDNGQSGTGTRENGVAHGND